MDATERTAFMDITLQDEPGRLVAIRRAAIPMADIQGFFDTTYRAVPRAVTAVGGAVHGPAIGWYHGMPGETVDVSAGFPVTGALAGPLGDNLEVVELPGGRALVATYVGAYDGLGEAWGEVMAAAGDRDPRGDMWEEYVTEPDPGGDPDANVTRLVLPLL